MYVIHLRHFTLNKTLPLAVLCSTIIEHVQSLCPSKEESASSSFCIYHYFDFKDKRRQTLDCFVRSALAQFCQQQKTIPQEVMDLYEDRGRKGQDATPTKLSETLLALLKQPERTYIMLDALDESRDQEETVQLIQRSKEIRNAPQISSLLVVWSDRFRLVSRA